jgi:hypothetical protein
MRVILNGIVPEKPCSLRRFCDRHGLDLNVVPNRRGNAYRVYFRTSVDSVLYGYGESVLAAAEDLVTRARGASLSLPGLTNKDGESIGIVVVPSKLYLGYGATSLLKELAMQLAPSDTDEDFNVNQDGIRKEEGAPIDVSIIRVRGSSGGSCI